MNLPSANTLIDKVTLTIVIRRLLDSKTTTLVEWQADAIAHHVINNVIAG